MIDRGSGIPVVLVPGIQGRWEWMAPAIDALAERCRVISYSLCDEPTSGFPCDDAHRFESYVGQIGEVMKRAGIDRAVLVGVSYGGPIAAEFAARHPDKVRGLVLASALPLQWIPDARARFYLRAPRLLSPLFMAESPYRMLPELRRAFPQLRKRLAFSIAAASRVLRALSSPVRMANRIRSMEKFAFTDPRRATMPALVVTGEDTLDRIVAPLETRRYLEGLPRARSAVLPGTGHLGFVTKPREFAAMIFAFADEVWTDARRASA